MGGNRKTILALFIWVMVAVIFMTALRPNLLAAADQIYCTCCSAKRECTMDPTCCNDGCCSS
uniref:Uncharacterized protein n=1 Tax=Setaria viridis TaxID=4556 RepID=A0A4U6VII8_SETVI|nr:hypothetical protein SEVIR_3G344900v2 [Setaria viridis]